MFIQSKFDAVKNGLPYHNAKFKFRVGPLGCTVLCGGISYAAIDYFDTGILPPRSKNIPGEGNPMQSYLYSRQATAHWYTWNRFANAFSVSQIPGMRSVFGEQDDINDLAAYLASRPVILCLYGGPLHGHHVIATGCDVAAGWILIADSNHPGDSTLIMQVGDAGWLSDKGTLWTGWFMDWGQYTDGDKTPPLAFKYCRTCHGLNTYALGVDGGCFAGAHDNHPDFEYFLPFSPGDGQSGWKVCGRCQGLYRNVGSDVPFCPAGGGLHFPQSNNANWQDLAVRTYGDGETGWCRCSSCSSLFWLRDNGDSGKCPAGGGGHTPVLGESYVVDNRTL